MSKSPEAAAETAAIQAEEAKPSRAEAIAKIKEMRAQLDRQEAVSGPSGAKPGATYTMLLDKSKTEELHPGHKIRWVNLRNDAKVQQRQVSGYERVPEVEGGRQVGNLALFKLPAEEHARRVEQIKKLNKDRLNAHNREAEAMAESIAKALRDNHGINVKPEHLYGERAAIERR